MKKRLLAIFIAIVCIFTIVGCKKSSTITFNADGGTVNGQEVYTETYKEGKGISSLPVATKDGKVFDGWYLNDKKIESIGKDQKGNIELIAKYKDYVFTTPQTDSVKLEADYANKDFYEDGIGTATVSQYVDGDTTIFVTSKGHKITIRYNGIDTPESTYKVEPWGFAASDFTKQALKNAQTIVLQTEDGKPGKENTDSTNNRYLAWVWVDGRLLNLDIVENGLAKSKASDTKYSAQFNQAVKPLANSRVRVYGEVDPKFNYSNEHVNYSLEEIHNIYGTDESIVNKTGAGDPIKISGIIVKKIGAASAYLQQVCSDDETGENRTYGIYLYGGYNENYKLEPGFEVIITGQIGYYNGTVQITNVTLKNVKIQNMNQGADINELIKVEELSNESEIKLSDYVSDLRNVGNIIQIKTPLKITKYYDTKNDDGTLSGAYTLTTEYVDHNGKTKKLDIRVSNDVALKDENGMVIDSGKSFVGKTITELTCILSYFDHSDNQERDGNVQLIISGMSDFTFGE